MVRTLLPSFPLPGLLLAAAALGLLATAIPPAPEPPEPGFEVFHMDSALAEGNSRFREVFVVDRVAGVDARIEEVRVLLDGDPLDVTWEPAAGPLERNVTFWFIAEAFDQQQTLTAEVGGERVMECRFGGGAGLSGLHPDRLRAMGQGHLVRCLDELEDG